MNEYVVVDWTMENVTFYGAMRGIEVKVKLKVFSVSPHLQVKLDPNRQVAN